MRSLISKIGLPRMMMAFGLLATVSGCVTYYQPLHGHDGFYHEGQHGPDVIVIEHYSHTHFGPIWHPWWSVPWLYIDRPLIAQPLAPVMVAHQRPTTLPVEERRFQRRIDRPATRRELPASRGAGRGPTGAAANPTRPTTTIHRRSPQQQAARPRPPRNQEPEA